MCSELKLLDIIGLQNRTSANFGIVSSQDFQYCILVEDGVYILQLCGLMDNYLKTMSCMKWFIKVNDFVLSSHLGININSFITSLPKDELYEAILRLDLSEELTGATPMKQQPVQAKWSSLGLIASNNCALGIITNTGTVSVYIFTINEVEYEEFIEAVNISKICLEYLSRKFFTNIFRGSTPSGLFMELKKRSEIVTPTTFTWSHLFIKDDKKFSLFIVGHLDGGVSVCRVNFMKSNETECNCTVIGYFQTGLRRPTVMHWQEADNNGLLMIGDLQGMVKAITVTNINYDSVNFENETLLWEEADHIRIEHFKVIVYENFIYVFIVKGAVLLICLINESGNVLDVYPFRIGDMLITGVEHYEDNTILVLAYTGILKEIKLFTKNNKIRIEWRHLFIDFKWWSHRTHGLIVSHNKVFFGILVSISKSTNIKKRKDHVRLLIFMNTAKKPMDALLSNETNLLTLYWDCFEILRLNGLLERKLSSEGLPTELDYDKLSLAQLKMCYWLAKSSEMMYYKTQVLQKYTLLKFDEFQHILRIKLALEHMRHLLQLLASGTQLSEFHMQSLDILNMFLKETIAHSLIPKLGLGKVTIDTMYDIIIVANELKYPDAPQCVWCEEKIIGLSCVPSHPDTRCQISFMPITKLPHYKCQFCKCTVHEELGEIYKILLCPYCDVPLKYVGSLISKRNGLTLNPEINNLDSKSNCSVDCVKETVDVTELEHAFVNFTANNEFVDIVQISSDENSDTETQENMQIEEIRQDS